MTYVTGCVEAVPKANREAYRQIAENHARMIRESGALKVVHCWGDDVPDGEITSFPKAVQCGEEEVVAFSWIQWESKEACDAGMKLLSEELPTMYGDASGIFDTSRSIVGGFEVLVEK